MPQLADDSVHYLIITPLGYNILVSKPRITAQLLNDFVVEC